VASVLEPELKAYQTHRGALLSRAAGKWVLIRETEVLGTFESRLDAINRGYELLGNVPFLVKQVTAVDAPESFTSSLLALYCPCGIA
jgi:hypothetical protein